MKDAKQRRLWVLLATSLGSSVVILDGVVVNLALPKIGADLHAGFSALQWISDSYALLLSALILLGGSLGDIIGRKKMYLIGLVSFGVCSLLCALAPNATALIIARALQGLAGALLVPGALAIINTNFPRELRGKAVGRWTAWTSLAIIAAPLIGGIILDVSTWRWIFLINLPLVLACFLMAQPSITESRDEDHRRIDVIGAGLAALSLTGITYGLIQGPVEHWHVAPAAALLVGTLFAAVFVWFESRAKDPMVRLSLFKSRNFSGSNLMTFAMYGALGGFFFALTIYLQTNMGYSSIKAGLSTLPISVLMVLFAGKVGALCAKYGPRRFMTAGPLTCALGIISMLPLSQGDVYVWRILPGVLLFGIGLVLTVAPLTTTVMASVDERQSGIASGINNAVSRAASLIVIAVLGLLGAAHMYRFAVVLCFGLTVFSGVTSFVTIRNVKIGEAAEAQPVAPAPK